MSCLFSILCLCKMLGFIMAPSDRQLSTTCKKPPKHNKKQGAPNPGVQQFIQPNFRVISPSLSLLVPSDHLNSALGWCKWEEQGEQESRKLAAQKKENERPSNTSRVFLGGWFRLGWLCFLSPCCSCCCSQPSAWLWPEGWNDGLDEMMAWVSFQSN